MGSCDWVIIANCKTTCKYWRGFVFHTDMSIANSNKEVSPQSISVVCLRQGIVFSQQVNWNQKSPVWPTASPLAQTALHIRKMLDHSPWQVKRALRCCPPSPSHLSGVKCFNLYVKYFGEASIYMETSPDVLFLFVVCLFVCNL